MSNEMFYNIQRRPTQFNSYVVQYGWPIPFNILNTTMSKDKEPNPWGKCFTDVLKLVPGPPECFPHSDVYYMEPIQLSLFGEMY